MREHDVSRLSTDELETARRELTASLALARPWSPVRVPIEAQLSAIDAEVTERARRVIRVCACAFATDSDTRMDGHLWNNPGHQERDISRYQDAVIVADRE